MPGSTGAGAGVPRSVATLGVGVAVVDNEGAIS